jgi:hypothetical protein
MRALLLPIILAAFPIVFLFEHNVRELLLSDLWSPLSISVGVGAAALLLALAAFRNVQKAALSSGLLVALFYLYGHAYNGLVHVRLFRKLPHNEYALLFVWVLLLSAGIYKIARAKNDLRRISRPLTAVAAIFLLIPCIQIGGYYASQKSWSPGANKTPVVSKQAGTSTYRPDIFYIVLDGYANSKVLKSFFDFDNSAFENYLQSKGFFVAKDCCSNYAQTMLSLASSLNMNYLDTFIPPADPASKDFWLVVKSIRNNAVTRLVKQHGYEYYHCSSGWCGTDESDLLDVKVSSGNINEFTTVLLQTTAMRPFLHGGAVKEDKVNRTPRLFAKLATIPASGPPKFVFAHLICPHPPCFFRHDGSPTPASVQDEWKLDGKWHKDPYLDQLLYANMKVEELVPNLINRPRPAIVVIASDHGSALKATTKDLWNHPPDDFVYERMHNFIAVYAGGHKIAGLTDTITPVNLFRVIFNDTFAAHLPILPEKCLFSGYDTPYKFSDVTAIARKPLGAPGANAMLAKSGRVVDQ